MTHIRRAGLLDAGPLSDLLCDIIRRGGTTAMTSPVSRQELECWMRAAPGRAAWHLAEDEAGLPLGVQWIEPHPALPPEACDIATFTRPGQTRLGVGSSLFDATRRIARALGYAWINATIRADNSAGLAYYQSRGFEPYAWHNNVPLAVRTRVNKVSSRFAL